MAARSVMGSVALKCTESRCCDVTVGDSFVSEEPAPATVLELFKRLEMSISAAAPAVFGSMASIRRQCYPEATLFIELANPFLILFPVDPPCHRLLRILVGPLAPVIPNAPRQTHLCALTRPHDATIESMNLIMSYQQRVISIDPSSFLVQNGIPIPTTKSKNPVRRQS